MTKVRRRYELLVPLKFNSGEKVPRELIRTTQDELQSEFGCLSAEGQVIQGFDKQSGGVDDRMVRFYVDVHDTAENLAFFMKLKESLKQRFQQQDIWITSHVVDVV